MSGGRKTIFLLDDNETNLLVGKSALAEYYNVFTFAEGARLFKTLERLIPDLILLDVEMPDMSGHQVLARLKEDARTAHIPVIFITATSNRESKLRGLSMGAVDYITKPFSALLLRERIKLHLPAES